MSSARVEAKNHIASIRAARRLRDGDAVGADDPNLADLTHVLALTSSELYAEGFHFIWEIVQNTDDADYNVRQPQLKIILTDDALHAWSNQAGFSRNDVESICGIGRSSKVTKIDTIGEKGIGFKSLFTVADRVTIHSEPYHFEFDTTTALGDLGMLIPTWAEQSTNPAGKGFAFPAEGTTVSLHFKNDTDVTALRDKLEHLDYSFLIFCRRIKVTEVLYINDAAGFHKTGKINDETGDTITLQITDSKSVSSSHRRYRIFHKRLSDMPQQLDRPRKGTSTLRLAFKLQSDRDSGLDPEMTYAFMPIKQFGFNFLIQANFILTANRHEVVPDHEWNMRLRGGLTDLIHSAITWFATSANTPARYQWPHYVGSLYSVHDAFFKPVAIDVCNRLKITPLLLTDANDANDVAFFQTPMRSVSIPHDFRVKGKLVLDGKAIARRSIHEGYMEDLAMRHALERLGVRRLNHYNFLCEYENMVQNDSTIFRNKPMRWHASVADVLLVSEQQFSTAFFAKCQNINMIPLSTGEWTFPKAANLFLPGSEIGDTPPGLSIKIVEAAACADKSRRLLFEALGIKPCTRGQICKAIVADHRNRPRGSLKDTVLELGFLFSSNYNPKPSDFFRFYSTPSRDGIAECGINIPFGEVGNTVRQQLGTVSSELRWMHTCYGDIPKEGQLEQFVDWLQSWSQLRVWPEINQDHQLTPVMTKLLASKGSKALLAHFRSRVISGVGLPVNDELWKQCVSELEVSTNQGMKKLCETALPKIANLSGGLFPSLDVKEPISFTWSFLREYGVFTTVNTRFLLQAIRNIKSAGDTTMIDAKVSRFYSALGKFEVDRELIKEAFTSEALIYAGRKGWVESVSCRWEADYSCTAFHIVSETHKRCQALFRRIIGLRNADLDDLLEEFRSWTTTTDSGYVDIDAAEGIYELLLDMNKMLRSKPATAVQIEEMRKLRMFPILCASTSSGRMLVRVQRSTDTFWIGDSPWQQKRFKGKVPLLIPIEGKTLRGVNAIFQTLKMAKKKLSRCVINESKSEGPLGGTDEDLTRSLEPRLPYLVSLLKHVQETKNNRKKFITQVSSLRIERVKKIKIRCFVRHEGKRIYGVDEEGEVCLKPGAKELIVQMNPELQGSDALDALAEHLSKYWNLQHQNMQLVYKVLTSLSTRRLIEAFERAGVTPPECEEANSVWTSFRQAMQAGSAQSITMGGDSRFGGPSSSTHGSGHWGDGRGNGRHNSGNDHRSNNFGGRSSNFQSRNFGSGVFVSRATNFAIPRWIDRTVDASVTDETAIQHRRYNSGGRHNRTASIDSLDDMDSSQQPRHGSGAISSPLRKRRLETETSASTEEQERAISKIGRQGERLVYDFLSQTLGPSFSHRHWTSRNRDAFFPSTPFPGVERNFSDFTYQDQDGKLAEYLAEHVPDYDPPSTATVAPTYHLEVKTSLDGIETPAVLRNNQIRLARRWSMISQSRDLAQQSDIYVLVRVYDLQKDDPPAPKICFFPDPWNLIFHGKLAIAGDEGVYVQPFYGG